MNFGCWWCCSEVRVSQRDARGAPAAVSLRGLRAGSQSRDGQQPDGHCQHRLRPAPNPRTRKSDNDDISTDAARVVWTSWSAVSAKTAPNFALSLSCIAPLHRRTFFCLFFFFFFSSLPLILRETKVAAIPHKLFSSSYLQHSLLFLRRFSLTDGHCTVSIGHVESVTPLPLRCDLQRPLRTPGECVAPAY